MLGGIITSNCTFFKPQLLLIIGAIDLVPVPLPGAGYSWTKRTNKHCYYSKHPTKYSAFEDAIVGCQKLGTSCSGVYDADCGSGKYYFHLCKSDRSLAYDRTGCVYTPDRPGRCKREVPCVGYVPIMGGELSMI